MDIQALDVILGADSGDGVLITENDIRALVRHGAARFVVYRERTKFEYELVAHVDGSVMTYARLSRARTRAAKMRGTGWKVGIWWGPDNFAYVEPLPKKPVTKKRIGPRRVRKLRD
jgi:hypothetical protein